MKPILLSILTICCVLLYASCAKNNKEDILAQQGQCDTSITGYAQIIKPILDQQCATSGCHNSTTKAGGYDLETFSSLQSIALGTKFLGSLKHETGFSPMPKNSGKLDDCSIQKIETWVNKGALNN